MENLTTVLLSIILGGLIGTYLRILWERRNSALLQKQEFKETRYKCIVILSLSLVDFKKNKYLLHQNNREYIQTPEDLISELKIELNNMILFASEEVLFSMSDFIKSPTIENYRKMAIAMRKDLWGGKISSKNIENLTL